VQRVQWIFLAKIGADSKVLGCDIGDIVEMVDDGSETEDITEN